MKIKDMKKAIFAASVLAATTAFGAGFQVLEQGASNMGTSMAGATVNASNDASAAYLNPAAVSFIDMEVGQTMVSTGLSAVLPTLGMSKDGKNYDCARNSFVPNIFTVHKFTEELFGSISVTAPFGLESQYDSNWIGRQHGVHSYMLTIDINPSVAYKVNDWLTIGGGVSAQYAYCKLTQGIAAVPFGEAIALNASGWGVGGNIGFTVEYAEGGRFGFQWRSEVCQDVDGTFRLMDVDRGDITASVSLPQTFTVGVYQRLFGDLENFAVMADYSYTAWSCFENLDIYQGSSLISHTAENWKDTSRVSVGLHYYPEEIEDLTLRFGVCYDESPVKGAQYRTVRIPCSDRIWFSTGFGYDLAENIKLDMAYVYIMTIGNSEIAPSQYGGSAGDSAHYYGHIHVISAQLSFLF